MSAERFKKPYSQWTSEDVDAYEAQIPATPLNEIDSPDGTIPIEYWINTGLRAHDGVRFLYVSVMGCPIEEVQAFLDAVNRGQVTRKNLIRIRPKDTIVSDIMPPSAMPRITLGKRS